MIAPTACSPAAIAAPEATPFANVRTVGLATTLAATFPICGAALAATEATFPAAAAARIAIGATRAAPAAKAANKGIKKGSIPPDCKWSNVNWTPLPA